MVKFDSIRQQRRHQGGSTLFASASHGAQLSADWSGAVVYYSARTASPQRRPRRCADYNFLIDGNGIIIARDLRGYLLDQELEKLMQNKSNVPIQ